MKSKFHHITYFFSFLHKLLPTASYSLVTTSFLHFIEYIYALTALALKRYTDMYQSVHILRSVVPIPLKQQLANCHQLSIHISKSVLIYKAEEFFCLLERVNLKNY